MTLLPSLAQIAAPLLQHDPLHRWAARTNQLNLTWGKRRIWERVSSPRYAAAQQVHLGRVLPRVQRENGSAVVHKGALHAEDTRAFEDEMDTSSIRERSRAGGRSGSSSLQSKATI